VAKNSRTGRYDSSSLRQLAEDKICGDHPDFSEQFPEDFPGMDSDKARELIHELRVHQIELDLT
jgi:hypothetical protein